MCNRVPSYVVSLLLLLSGCGNGHEGEVPDSGGIDGHAELGADEGLGSDAGIDVEVPPEVADAGIDIGPDTSGCACDRECPSIEPCTRGRCVDGACVSEPLACDDDDACTIDSCDPLLGCQHQPLGLDCDDDNPCTTDSCDRLTGACVSRPNVKPCDDGDACTRVDVCQAGACVGTQPVTCACRTTAACDSATGLCTGPPAADGTPCDDGDVCTGTDTCSGGECVGSGPGAPKLELIGSAPLAGREPLYDFDLGRGPSDGLVYAAAGFGVEVYDVSSPETPTPVAWMPTPGEATSIRLAGDRAFVADGLDGLRAVDLSKPLASAMLGGVGVDGYARRLQLIGGLAYVAVEDVGLRIVDVSEPERPVLVGGVDTECGLDCGRDVHVVGSLAYVADGWYQLTIVDVSDPAAPAVVNVVESPGVIESVTVADGVALAASSNPGSAVGLRVFDVSDPLAATEEAALVFDYGVPRDVLVLDDVAWVPTTAELRPVDVCNPREPSVIGALWTNESWDQNILIRDDLAYLSTGGSGLALTTVDIADPAELTAVGSFPNPGNAHGLWVADGLAYLADGYAGLRILDVSDPTNPVDLVSAPEFEWAARVQLVGQTAYVASLWHGIHAVDVGDPQTPALLGKYDSHDPPAGGQAWEVEVVDGLAYAAFAAGFVSATGLGILDVSDPSQIQVVGSFNEWTVDAVDVVGDFAYVVTYAPEDFGIIDISTPTNPQAVGTFSLPMTPDDQYRSASDVQVVGELAYVTYTAGFADKEGGLSILDVSDPSAPTLLGLVDADGRTRRLHVVGDYAYLGEDSFGVRVIDVSDPHEPRSVGLYDTPGLAWSVQVVGDLVYVADGPGLLQIFHDVCGEQP